MNLIFSKKHVFLKGFVFCLGWMFVSMLSACSPCTVSKENQTMALKYQAVQPKEWGEKLKGVVRTFPTHQKEIALTMDACGGPKGSGMDRVLIDYLIAHQIPATLFINARWIDANPDLIQFLASQKIFEIENHGFQHRPASVNGRMAYREHGTKNICELIQEIDGGAKKIESVIHQRSHFYRSGTAYYDEVAIKIANDLHQTVAGYSVLGDAGATYKKDQVVHAFLTAKPGDIVIVHFNHPNAETGVGVMEAIPLLQEKGFRFVKLSEVVPEPIP